MKYPVLLTLFSLVFACAVNASGKKPASLSMQVIGQYRTAVFDDGAAEIVAHDEDNQRIFVINAAAATVDVLDISDPANPLKIGQIDVSPLGAGVNSVAIHEGLVAVAIEASPKQAPGKVGFYDAASLTYISDVTVGSLPDMVIFTPNGRYVLVANEGEPSDDYVVDPEGSVSIINLSNGPMHAAVSTADFRDYIGREDDLRASGVRIFGPGANAAQDMEPEYITVSGNSKTAWVSLQEANALAVIDIRNAKVKEILPLGSKDHRLAGNAFDASNRDGAINITNWPTRGMYMPDAISSYRFRGDTYIVTANEGDSRDYDGFSEEVRVKDLVLDAAAFPDASILQLDENLGRLKTTTVNGDSDGDGDFDEIYSYGARSFSIWSEKGERVFDSGADFERITAAVNPANFNSTNDENGSFDNRSDDKGPEPEGITVGKIKGRTLAFIGLERVGGIMVYDISNPDKVRFLDYINNRNFDVDAQLPDGTSNPLAGDLAPEGLVFISAGKSPNGKPLLVVGNEVSGTTTLYEVKLEKENRSGKRDK